MRIAAGMTIREWASVIYWTARTNWECWMVDREVGNLQAEREIAAINRADSTLRLVPPVRDS